MADTASQLLNRLLARGKFRHIQVLLMLTELGSVQRTAERIGMTQSSVTKTLASLESLVGTPLFLRHARGVLPTPACADVVPVARALLQGVATGAEALAARGAQAQTTVRLLASASAVNGLLARALPAFHNAVPSIRVQLREAEADDQWLAIAGGEVDLAVSRRRAVVPEGWRYETLQEDRLAVVCSASHPLARGRRLRWRELAKETWLLPPTGSLARNRLDEFMAAIGATPPAAPLVTRSLTMLERLIVDEGWVSFLPLSFVQHLIDAGVLAELNTTERCPIEALAVLAPEVGATEATLRLSTFLREQFARPRRRRAVSSA